MNVNDDFIWSYFPTNSNCLNIFQTRALGDTTLELTAGSAIQVAAVNANNDNIAARFNLIENAINAITTPDCN